MATTPAHPISASVALPRVGVVRRFWKSLGPGVVAGAADDDPSGIVTYSIAGAQFGTAFLWSALLTWPMMAAVQVMCARIGMVTGTGLMGALREKFPRPVLAAACLALFVANTINIGADLAGMADAAELVSGIDSHVYIVSFALLIGGATLWLRYATLANALKWLALVLFSYIACAFLLSPDWSEVLRAAVIPARIEGRDAWATLVAILGTTISPYLFFWQASQEVEEEKALRRKTLVARWGATPDETARRRLDVGIGTFFSNGAMFFIILTTALTLHRAGAVTITSARDVAQALEPLAGRFSTLLYLIGILGTGALAIPTLAGSAAYALAELLGWREGIDEHFRGAPAFYAVIFLSLAAGVALDLANVSAIKALYWSAVLNGLLAPFLLTGILIAASDASLMRGQPSSRLGRAVVLVTTLLMYVAGAMVFIP